MPPTWTTLVVRNPEPEIVSVSALEPAGTRFGLIEVTAGVGVVLSPPPLPEPEPPLAQPLITIKMPSAKNQSRETSKNLQGPKNLTERTYLSTNEWI